MLLLLACCQMLACEGKKPEAHYDAEAPLTGATTIAVACGKPIRYNAIPPPSAGFASMNMAPAERQQARDAFESEMLRTEIQRIVVAAECEQRRITVTDAEVEAVVQKNLNMRSGINKAARDQIEATQRVKVLDQLRIRKLIESLRKSHEIETNEAYVKWLFQQLKARTTFLHSKFKSCLETGHSVEEERK